MKVRTLPEKIKKAKKEIGKAAQEL